MLGTPPLLTEPHRTAYSDHLVSGMLWAKALMLRVLGLAFAWRFELMSADALTIGNCGARDQLALLLLYTRLQAMHGSMRVSHDCTRLQSDRKMNE